MRGVGASLRRGLAAAALVLAFSAPPAALAAEVPESDAPIKLAMNEWTGAHLTTAIAGEILKRMGYTVEYVTAGNIPSMHALSEDGLTATLEIWLNTVGDNYEKTLASGNTEDAGELGLDTREGWLYPTYVKEMCPGLPDWQALKDCTDLFVTPETAPMGRLVDYPADWPANNPERLAAFGLNFKAVPAGSEGSLIAEFRSAVERRQPVLMMFWSPHWLFNDFDAEFVNLPKYDPACIEDRSWGINPEKTYDCAWYSGKVRKLVWSGMKDKWPAAHRLLKSLTVTNGIQIPLMKAIDVDGVPLEKAINDWLDANGAVWKPWVEAALKG